MSAVALLSIPKQRVLVILPSILSVFSLIGSACVIYLIVCRKNKSSNRSYNRIMFMTCLFDLICANVWMVGSLPVPKETGFYGARGNTQTCNVMAFFLQLRFVEFTYNVGIVLYFLLTIRYAMKQERFAKQVEPFVHIVSILFPCIAAFTGVFIEVFNPVGYGNVCYIGTYPPTCRQHPEIMPCLRGQSAPIVVWFFMLGPGACYSIFYYVAIVLIYTSVRKQEMRTIRSSLNSSTVKARIRAVATQSILYAFFFFNSSFWICVLPFLTSITDDPLAILSHKGIYGIQLMAEIFFSFQGFFTFVIYVRPRYLNLRKTKPHKSSLWAFCNTLRPTESSSEDDAAVRSSNRIVHQRPESSLRNGNSGRNPEALARAVEECYPMDRTETKDDLMAMPPDEPTDEDSEVPPNRYETH